MAASVSSGRPVETRGVREVTLVPVALAENATVTVSTAPAAGAGSGLVALGLTVITGTPWETREVVVNEAANADWVATGPLSPGLRSTASVITPEPRRRASRAAISLPSPEEVTSTAAGVPAALAICSRASTLGTTR